MLRRDPDEYIYPAVGHGVTWDARQAENPARLTEPVGLPDGIAVGIDDLSKRGDWNKPALDGCGLPTETWREVVTRRQRYAEMQAQLVSGKVQDIHDLVTLNLNIEKFAKNVITQSEGPELLRAFWHAIRDISVLDPTCGSGAFLFAALNVLEPLYNACLEGMRGFLGDLERTERPHLPDALQDFRDVLKQVEKHPSERYFILKSIVLNNLYGVDIMEEAVEICKLRLFLKLVAQLKSYDQIEPLPDIDFNVRAGNTLVGFTSLDAVRQAMTMTPNGQHRALFEKDRVALARIEREAKATSRVFNVFREQQTSLGGEVLANDKAELRRKLERLRGELDGLLATEYGKDQRNDDVYNAWQSSHQPFHWFAEFYGIMRRGGFDVIIGNPPYLETRQVPYSTRHFACEGAGAIHGMCIERSLELSVEGGGISMIVPLSLVSTQRMTSLQHMLEKDHDCWYSNFSWRPGKLFDTVNRALTIFVIANPTGKGATHSTAYLKWNSDSREHLIPTISFAECPRERKAFWAPKLGQRVESSILKKFTRANKTMEKYVGRSRHLVYYRTDGGLYWKVFTDFAPAFYVNGIPGNSSRQTSFALLKDIHVQTAIAVLSSDVYWWWYTITSNLRHLNPSDWRHFPVPEAAMDDPSLHRLGTEYIADLRKNSTMLVRNQNSTGRTETQSFKVQKSKRIIDEIDRILAKHYGFTDDELDFIINYDIKYRMGQDGAAGG